MQAERAMVLGGKPSASAGEAADEVGDGEEHSIPEQGVGGKGKAVDAGRAALTSRHASGGQQQLGILLQFRASTGVTALKEVRACVRACVRKGERVRRESEGEEEKTQRAGHLIR